MSNPNSTKFPEWSPVSAIRPNHAEIFARLFRSLFPAVAEKANGRIEKAVAIMTRAGARRLDRNTGLYEVESDSGKGWYQVDLDRKTCTCPDSLAGNLCKHRLAVGLQLQGHDWLLSWHIDHTHQIHVLRRQVDEAWNATSALATTYENKDVNAPDLDDCRARMIKAEEVAHDLHMQLNALILETP